MKKETFMGNTAGARAFAKGDLKNFVIANTPGGIEAQEAEEQIKLCSESFIPKEMTFDYKQVPTKKEIFEKMGIKFLKEKDDLFFIVELPNGWKIRPTSHSMWNELIDNKGKVIAEIFYKGAFYDRSAFIRLREKGGDK